MCELVRRFTCWENVVGLRDLSERCVRWDWRDMCELLRSYLCKNHRLNMKLDLQSLFGLLCTAVLIVWDFVTPPSPSIWAHLRGRYWAAKIDDTSLWPPGKNGCGGGGILVCVISNREMCEVSAGKRKIGCGWIWIVNVGGRGGGEGGKWWYIERREKRQTRSDMWKYWRGEGEVIYLFKWFLPAVTALEEGGRGSAPCDSILQLFHPSPHVGTGKGLQSN
jgi:hypothetical protein